MTEQAERHTLGEAARLLRISRHTLDKWLDRLGIEPTRHAWDYRFFTISGEDLQRIKEARAQMPGTQTGRTGAFIPIASKLDDDRSPTAVYPVRDVSPTFTPTPRQRPIQRDTPRASGESLPAGWMSRTDCADLHNFPRTTLRRWAEDGRIETSAETFGGEHGMFPTAQPVTARGMAQFYALAHRRSDFTRCPACPHDELSDTDTAEASAE